VSQKTKGKAAAAGSHEPPARARVDGEPPDPEDIRDTLLRACDVRSKALLSFAEQASPEGIIGWTDDMPPKPIMFPAYELQVLMTAVTSVNEAEIRHLRELGKMSPTELEAAVNARLRLAMAKRGQA